MRWQSELLSSSRGEELREYWQKQLAGELPILNLPTDRPRPPVQTYRGATHILKLDEQLIQELRNLAIASGTSLYKITLAAFFVLLYRYTNQEDILVGSPMLGRWGGEFKGIVGYLVNPVVLRAAISGNLTFKDFLVQISRKVKEAQKYQDYPFPLLVEQLQPQRDPSRSPLFQVSFTWQKQHWCKSVKNSSGFQRRGLEMEPYPLGHQRGASFDLDVMMMEIGEVLQAGWQYNTDIFDAATIARMAGHFQTLLLAIATNPEQQISELPLLTQAERQQLLVEWNNTTKDYPQDKCIHQLFEEQVERSPNAVAVVFEGEQLTYRELNARANQLAHYLQTLGVGAEVLVGICVERAIEMVVGILGILKAGGAYVPLDPTYPEERLSFMLEDSSVPVLLTQLKLMEKLPQHSACVICLDSDWSEIAFHRSENPTSTVTPDNLAYIIYTSGSTGFPKGVLIQHRSLVNYTTAAINEYGIEKCDACGGQSQRVLQFASISFDASTEEIYPCLTSGATLVLRTDSMLDSVDIFLQKCRDWNLTVLSLPTAYWQELTAILSRENQVFPPSLRLVIIGGEKALTERWKTWLEYVGQQVRLVNTYGPTEATVVTTICDLSATNPALTELPIGRPISNVQAYILDRYLQPVPIGVPGELHIGGDGLARGYLNRPDLTDEKFIPNPFSSEPGERLYKTGDLARYMSDGNIEFLGRIDNQVKIRGFRIELGEIEALLAQHPDVLAVVVIVREDTPGNQRLVAYITSNLIPERVPYHSECQLELDGNTVKLNTEDISSGGVGVVGMPAIDESRHVRLRLQLPFESEARWLSGTIAWSRPLQVGIKFQLTPTELVLIEQSVAYQLETQGLWKTLQRTLSGSLRDYLKQKLPDYMIPSAFVLMKALPLTPNGKIDRRPPTKSSKEIYQTTQTTMTYWLFQGNPKYYRIIDGIRDFEQMPWLTTRYAKDMAPGDGLLVWKSGDKAGIYANLPLGGASLTPKLSNPLRLFRISK